MRRSFEDISKDVSELLRIAAPILSEHLDRMEPFLNRDAEIALLIEFRAEMIEYIFGNTARSNGFVVEDVRKIV